MATVLPRCQGHFPDDGNGNLVTRTLGSDTYVLQYDLEGRVVEVRKNDTLTVTFVYDGDGRQVKSTVDGVTNTVYIGDYYEKEGNTVRTYYYHAGKRVAMREDGTLYWLLTDHPSLTLRASLGSTTMALAASGTPAAERRYYAYGDERDISGTLHTQYGFTGQREEADIGLYFYNARWYDAALRRFVQADAIVPQPGNPQSLNRYSYALNNPLRYTDPSGSAYEQTAGFHPWKWDMEWVERYKAAHGGAEPTRQDWRDYVFSLTHHGSGPGGSWTEEDWLVYEQLRATIGADLMEQIGKDGGLGSGLYSLAGQVILALAGVDLEPLGERSGALIAITALMPPGSAGWTLGNVIALDPSEPGRPALVQHEYLHVLHYRCVGVRFLFEYYLNEERRDAYEDQAQRIRELYAQHEWLPSIWHLPWAGGNFYWKEG
ncbi:MAG: RHS repeat-associated core domain-containing protein [Chloroflexi bacterium]|nr:RHS repeat-associated core domain-containing protein [Chloroflexota bacterium]